MKYVPIHITDKFSTKTSYEKGSLVFIWDEFLEDDNAISLPSLVEEKADILIEKNLPLLLRLK